MKCLRSGWCCMALAVVIVDDPALGVVEGNLIAKMSGERCKHFRGDKPGEHSCALHDEPWYEETPCFSHGQIERGETYCRMGNYILHGKQRPERVT